MTVVTHRGSAETAESYRGIPVHAAPGVHEKAAQLLAASLPRGARIADLGAGQGSLSQRLKDAGFDVVAFELEREGWMVPDVECIDADIEGPLDSVRSLGPFDAWCVIDVIEHLENPRGFLRELIAVAGDRGGTLVISMPNPLDTFSCITLFSRGVFNWFSRAHYAGGGHISLLPFWMVDEHLKFLGVHNTEWHFVAPYVHPSAAKRIAYGVLGSLRRLLSRSADTRYFDGQTALVVATFGQRDH